VADDEDWRLRGQEDYLQGATLVRKRYKAWSDDWEHDHCEFCWTKFMDPDFSPEHRKFIDKNPEVLTEGYAVDGRAPDRSSGLVPRRVFADDRQTVQSKIASVDRNDYWWICPNCVKDFAVRFEWIVIDGPENPETIRH
jgi:hypothetical protein